MVSSSPVSSFHPLFYPQINFGFQICPFLLSLSLKNVSIFLALGGMEQVEFSFLMEAVEGILLQPN